MRGKKTPLPEVRRGLEAYLRLGSYAAAEEETGIGQDALWLWFRDPEHSEMLRELSEEQVHARKRHARALALEAWESLRDALRTCRAHLEAGKPADAVGAARAMADIARTATEAVRLDEGSPTSIARVTSELSDEEVVEEVDRVLKGART